MHPKISSAKWWPFCTRGDDSTHWIPDKISVFFLLHFKIPFLVCTFYVLIYIQIVILPWRAIENSPLVFCQYNTGIKHVCAVFLCNILFTHYCMSPMINDKSLDEWKCLSCHLRAKYWPVAWRVMRPRTIRAYWVPDFGTPVLPFICRWRICGQWGISRKNTHSNYDIIFT